MSAPERAPRIVGARPGLDAGRDGARSLQHVLGRARQGRVPRNPIPCDSWLLLGSYCPELEDGNKRAGWEKGVLTPPPEEREIHSLRVFELPPSQHTEAHAPRG